MQQTLTKEQNDATKVAQAIFVAMKALLEVMARETDLLKNKDYAAMESMRHEKTKLVRDYHMNIGLLAQQPHLLKATSLETQNQLRTLGLSLAQATENNARALKAAIVGTQSLLQTIMSAARSSIKRSDCYTDTRKAPLNTGSYSPVCIPVAVNRTA